jgi:hypothetical protein
MWQYFNYSDTQRGVFSYLECQAIIDYHKELPATTSKFTRGDGAPLRDSGIYWLFRNSQTHWVFDRLGQALEEYNKNYQYDINKTINSAQLTRYTVGQQYGWHVDVGYQAMSLRKVSLVLELSGRDDHSGGGLEIFHDFELSNKLWLDQGDVALFSAFTPNI